METGPSTCHSLKGSDIHVNVNFNVDDVGSAATATSASVRASGGSGRRRGRRQGRPRKRRKCCCENKDVKRGVGAVIFTLGIPVALTGLIFTVVAYSSLVVEAPPSFPVLGPLLMGLSALLFFAGAALTELIPPAWLADCCCLPESLQAACWRRCPRLCLVLHPNDVRVLNKGAALHALTTEPARSALKKPRAPVPDMEAADGATSSPAGNDVDEHRGRGVTFSDGGGGGEREALRLSTSTDQSDGDVFAERSSISSSVVSLRHCRIHPSVDASWASLKPEGPVFTISEGSETPGIQPDPSGSQPGSQCDTTALMEEA